MSDEALAEVKEKAAERRYETPEETVHLPGDDAGVEEQKACRNNEENQESAEKCNQQEQGHTFNGAKHCDPF